MKKSIEHEECELNDGGHDFIYNGHQDRIPKRDPKDPLRGKKQRRISYLCVKCGFETIKLGGYKQPSGDSKDVE